MQDFKDIINKSRLQDNLIFNPERFHDSLVKNRVLGYSVESVLEDLLNNNFIKPENAGFKSANNNSNLLIYSLNLPDQKTENYYFKEIKGHYSFINCEKP